MNRLFHAIKNLLAEHPKPADPPPILRKIYFDKHSLDLGQSLPFHDAVALHHLAEKKIKKGFKVLELGSWKGKSSVILGHVCGKKGATLTCVATWKGSVGIKNHSREVRTKNIQGIFKKNLEAFQISQFVQPVCTSTQRFFSQNTSRYDFIFIDGDHRHEAFCGDLTNALRCLNKGGTICGHDSEIKFTLLSPGEQKMIRRNRQKDFLRFQGPSTVPEGVHPGVVLGLFEILQDRHFLIKTGAHGNGVWFWNGLGKKSQRDADLQRQVALATRCLDSRQEA